jgi:hypothetical protein
MPRTTRIPRGAAPRNTRVPVLQSNHEAVNPCYRGLRPSRGCAWGAPLGSACWVGGWCRGLVISPSPRYPSTHSPLHPTTPTARPVRALCHRSAIYTAHGPACAPVRPRRFVPVPHVAMHTRQPVPLCPRVCGALPRAYWAYLTALSSCGTVSLWNSRLRNHGILCEWPRVPRLRLTRC